MKQSVVGHYPVSTVAEKVERPCLAWVTKTYANLPPLSSLPPSLPSPPTHTPGRMPCAFRDFHPLVLWFGVHCRNMAQDAPVRVDAALNSSLASSRVTLCRRAHTTLHLERQRKPLHPRTVWIHPRSPNAMVCDVSLLHAFSAPVPAPSDCPHNRGRTPCSQTALHMLLAATIPKSALGPSALPPQTHTHTLPPPANCNASIAT